MEVLLGILGALLIFVGVVMGLLSWFAAGFASRATTWWEHSGRPLAWFLVPAGAGLAILLLL